MALSSPACKLRIALLFFFPLACFQVSVFASKRNFFFSDFNSLSVHAYRVKMDNENCFLFSRVEMFENALFVLDTWKRDFSKTKTPRGRIQQPSFAKKFVSNDCTFHQIHVDGRQARTEKRTFTFSNENGYFWMGPQCALVPQALYARR